MKYLLKVILSTCMCFLLSIPLTSGSVQAGDKTLVVGGKDYTEAYVLAELARQLLEKQGFTVEVRTGVGSTLARRSLENAQFDLYYEYTGTAYTVYYHEKDEALMSSSNELYEWVKKQDARKGLVWLDPVGFNNTYTLMMKKNTAQQLGIESISDLAAYVQQNPEALTIGLDSEFWERPDGFKKLSRVYGFRLPVDNVKKMTIGLTYQALKDDQIDLAMGFSTDGRIKAFGFVNLVDDRTFFPVYNPAPVIRKEVLEKYPEIRDTLKPLTGKLNTEEMQKLNAAVDIDHKNEKDVAAQWLKAQGLL